MGIFSPDVYSSWKGLQKEKFKSIKRLLGPFEADMFRDKLTLDIGCGFGYLEKEFQGSFVGIDNNLSMLTKQVTDFPRVLGDGDKMPFLDCSFDTIISIDTVHLLKMDDYTRVLKPGGIVLFSTFFNRENYQEKKEMMMEKIGKLEFIKDFEIHGKEKEYVVIAVKR